MEPLRRAASFAQLAKGAAELLFFLPVALTAAVYCLSDSAVWPWVISLAPSYWIGSVTAALAKVRRRGFKLLLSAVIGVLLSALVIVSLDERAGVLSLAVCGLISAAFSYKGMSESLKGWTSSFPNSQLLTSVCIYVAVQPMKIFVLKELADYNGILIIGGIASVVLFFFMANERLLNSETADTGKSETSIAFKRYNRLMVVILLGFIAVLAMFRNIQQALERMIKNIVDAVMAWLNRPRDNEPPQSQPPVQEQQPMLPEAEQQEPAAWVLLLEQIFKIAATVLVIVVVCFALFFLGLKLYRLIKATMAKLMERSAERQGEDTGYTDEVESLMSFAKLKNELKGSLRKWMPMRKEREPGWNDLTNNAERVRYLYMRLLRAGAKLGYAQSPHLTPRETAADMLARKQSAYGEERTTPLIEAYEAVRYGERPASDAAVAELKRNFDPVE